MLFSQIKIKTTTLFLLFFTLSLSSISQTFIMTNGGSASVCTGTFLDPGGAGNYAGGSSNWTYTICNPTAGQPIYVDFSSFDLWSNSCIWGASVDELFIYNGPNIGSPLIGVYSDNSGAPNIIVGASGCLTFRFLRENLGGFGCSSNSGNPGWSAAISCTPPPPDGSNCFSAYPFCTTLAYDFQNSTGGSSPTGPNYGCLFSQPNPVWYYMEVDQNGSFQIALSQTTGTGGSGVGLDVDFALYGPFTSVNTGCTSVMGGGSPPIQCSFSASNTETIGIGLPGGTGSGATTPPAAVAGQIYIVLLTNFSNQPGYISFNQTGGSGIADCSIVNPCDISAITAIPSACNPLTNTFNLTGQITFVNPPTVGTLTVTSTCGGSQIFNAPFVSPLSYTLSGLPSNSASCSVTAVFSDDATCTNSQSFSAPAPCVTPCSISAGSSSISVCPGATINLSSTTVSGATYAWTGPTGYSATGQNQTSVVVPSSANTYLYTVTATTSSTTCSDDISITVNVIPTVSAGTYSAVCIVASDVSLSGTPSGGTFSGTGVSGNNFSPSFGTQTISYNYTDGNGCSNSANTVITVNPLPVTSGGTYAAVCITSADVALTGTPAGGTFSGTGVTGTSFDPSAGTQTITYSFTDANGCSNSANTSITVNPLPIVSAGTYPTVCESNGLVNLVGIPIGGVFSGSGVVATTFNPFAGTQTINYTYTDANGCSNNANSQITVTPLAVLDITTPTMTCDTTLTWVTWNSFVPNPAIGVTGAGTNVTVNQNPGTFTSTPVMFNGIVFPTQYNVPINSSAIRLDQAGIITFCFDSPVPNPQIALSSIGNGGQAVEIQTSAPYSVVWPGQAMTYTNNQSFTGAEGFTIVSFPGMHSCISLNFLQGETYINLAIGVPDINCAVPPICVGESLNLTASGGFAYLWTPSTGLNSPTTATVTATPASTITYTVSDPTNAGCSIGDQITITVDPLPIVNAGTYTPVCADAAAITLIGTPAGGTFSGTGVTGNSFNPASGTQTVTYSYTNANGCSNTATSQITVNPLPSISAGADQTVCFGTSISLNGAGAVSYLWNNGGVDGQSFIPTLGSTTFIVTGTDVNGCQNTDQVAINVLPTPVANASSDISAGEAPLTVTFFNSSINSSSYNWNFGNGTSTNTVTLINQTATYNQSGDYWMILTASNGICQDQDSVLVIVLPIPPPTIHVPNVFTPNGDGSNDVFFLESTNLRTLNVIIFNRWGEVMHEINAPSEFWNGITRSGMANEGVYFYKYTAEGLDGSTSEGHGHVTLVNQ